MEEYSCVYAIIKCYETEENALAVACIDKNDAIHYGMKIFDGELSGCYIDSTRLIDIRSDWLVHEKRLTGKINMMDRMDDDEFEEPAVLIPWRYACEFETSEIGSKVISTVYHALNEIDKDEFQEMIEMDDDE